MTDYINFTKDVALRAGKIQLSRMSNLHEIGYKGSINIVTEVDRECEELIVGEIHKKFPEDDVLAEEGSGKRTKSGVRWIVDPLDGTVNYAHDFPFFCVSIAIEKEGELIAGVVYDPCRDEMFEAKKGGGAKLNGKSIHVSEVDSLKRSLLATGFAYNVQEEDRFDNLDNFGNFVKRAQAVRRPGSAAIDLAWVASGRIDGFWELFLKPWDMAAGIIIIREAGGLVTTFNGEKFDLYGDEILASNGKIHREMMEVLKTETKQ